MLIDGMLGGFDDVRTTAAASEAAGYAGLWTGETQHDPFLQLRAGGGGHRAGRARHGDRDRVRPHADDARQHGYDLAALLAAAASCSGSARRSSRTSSGGSRCRGRTRRRACASSCRAMRAIWACWQDGTKLDFRGDFYTHTLMTPFFSPPARTSGVRRRCSSPASASS